ncbi:DNA helicase [Mergibacter septicus]|uniref:DNA helicase n=1 Tax=Mergibacter septicus TaxID=221402 RepID=A0A8E3SCC9_9PAST|nr:DEAD/DEAH box helicase family protein [Mergibacter septicus]AWX16218.1 DNA helicase [Mergibacter septicus]QDJ15470.1 DNA helicase [Mergibacter septicus]UTU48660.1 DEAD/DEAH box helicase family protein [Mergibacter septicus]WMR95710.1 DEAD/DEAH box helicase family protein [Mergibacter septicus]
MIGIKLKNFQEKAVDWLYQNTELENKEAIILQAPTGSGKTIILVAYIEKYLDYHRENTVFCWFSPGKGNLETQSKEKMEKFCPQLQTGTIDDVLLGGFRPGSTYFINWEKITKKGNIAISDTERTNLYEHIARAHNKGLQFVCIIDEEHLNDTSKANDVIKALASRHEIRVSATPVAKALGEFYSINEVDVINEGLITRAMYVNFDLKAGTIESIDTETDLLIEKAVSLREQIAKEYISIGADIRPLVLVQFPNLNDTLIERVEEKLNALGYSYENGLVASWFSVETKEDKNYNSKKLGKINLGDEGKENYITRPNATPVFLLFKQALATGWDCPRAKILVKLRENMSEKFEIQTLGRLRRMPMAKHYDNDLLDNSYLYTFDEKYKLEALKIGAYETQRLFLKEKPREVELVKEIRNADLPTTGEVEIIKYLYEFLKTKYSLVNNFNENAKKLENNGYIFGKNILSSYLKGKATTLKDLEIQENMSHESINYEVDTHKHGMDLRHEIDALKKYTGLDYSSTRKILSRLFLKNTSRKYKLLSLTLKEFYAFIINNKDKIKDVFIEFSGQHIKNKQITLSIVKTEIFKIPLEENYKYRSDAKSNKVLESNAYEKYTVQMIDSAFRSTSERLFERYCDASDNVDFLYKNGDSGSQYLSIMYSDGFGRTKLFYPDYIIRLQSGEIWLIETKGGESNGQDKNIDVQVENKFKEFKRFANEYGYNFAFVRDRDEELYYNNIEYKHSLSEDEWKPLDEII